MDEAVEGVALDSVRVLGAAWPQHFNRPMAEAMTANIRRVGMPRWDAADQALARGIQRETNAPGYRPRGLDTAVAAVVAGMKADAGGTRRRRSDRLRHLAPLAAAAAIIASPAAS